MAPSVGLDQCATQVERKLTNFSQDDNKSLKDIAREKNAQNPSQLGDPVSLRAETSNTKPTPDDLGAKVDSGRRSGTSQGSGNGDVKGGKSLKQRAQEKLDTNPSQLGDPVSLKAETSDTEVTGDDRGARGTSKNSGKPKM